MATCASTPLPDLAEQALALMRRQGFDQAQVDASERRHTELNLALNEPSLLRSGHSHKMALVGMLGGRRASTELAELSGPALADAVTLLWTAVQSAPQDDANAVSSGQQLQLRQGPLPEPGDDPHALAGIAADAMADLRAWRSDHTPTVMIDEAYAAHLDLQRHTLTSAGSCLASRLGWYELSVMAAAHEDRQTSSFNYCGGNCHALAGQRVADLFGIGDMLRDLTEQVHTVPSPGKFSGELVLHPAAVADLLGWLLGQLADQALISGSSLYAQRLGQEVASPLLTLHSRFDAPGMGSVSADAFFTPSLTLLHQGRLMALTPSLYASRKTGLAHQPVAAEGWALQAGDTPRAALVAAVHKGALVGRLSMGRPAANGDFSGLLKNSFLIENGQRGAALREVMVSGNVAQMLRAVRAVSTERIDTASWLLPWLRIDGLDFC